MYLHYESPFEWFERVNGFSKNAGRMLRDLSQWPICTDQSFIILKRPTPLHPIRCHNLYCTSTDPSLHSCTFGARTRDPLSRRAPCGIRTGNSCRSTSSGRSVRNRFACSRCPYTGTCSCYRRSPGSRCSPRRSACTCRHILRDCRSGTSVWRNIQSGTEAIG